ncbi:MAG: hypothetical protein GY708_20310 [Actinomycetia bacterium]|nr:hypothetical protein [Actinomycetes bacterium]
MVIERLFLPAAEKRLRVSDGPGLASAVAVDALANLASVSTRLPAIGGVRNVFGVVPRIYAWFVSLHLAMISRDKTAADTIAASHADVEAGLAKMPGWMLRLNGRSPLSRPACALFRRQAIRSQRREYPDGFVRRVEEASDIGQGCATNGGPGNHEISGCTGSKALTEDCLQPGVVERRQLSRR